MQDRPPPTRRNPLATHGRTIHWVTSRPDGIVRGRSAYPREAAPTRTYLAPLLVTRSGHVVLPLGLSVGARRGRCRPLDRVASLWSSARVEPMPPGSITQTAPIACPLRRLSRSSFWTGIHLAGSPLYISC